MKYFFTVGFLWCFCVVAAVAGNWHLPAGKGVIMQAEDAVLTSGLQVVAGMDNFFGKKGVKFKNSSTPGKETVTFELTAQRAGRYVLVTHAYIDEYGQQLMSKARSKYQSMFLELSINGSAPTKRVVFVPWSRHKTCYQTLGKFNLSAGKNIIELRLPQGIIFDQLRVTPYRGIKAPKAAREYPLMKLPPHPRLMVNSSILARLRKNVKHKENSYFWNKVKSIAQKPCKHKISGSGEVPHNPVLENAAACKAFYYLITGDKAAGRDAVELIKVYLPRVEFGNLLDITRETGSAIYTASLVYDWCYSLLDDRERTLIRQHLMRLADDMECGWPPFKQSILIGHGNEAQICRDLLSMSIAIYDEDPEPFRYCSYLVLEKLVPNRKFDYQSPRHSQGISYSSYRFSWEMYSAWIFKRLLQREVFDRNIKQMGYFWTYMRTPWGFMFRDGDGTSWSNKWGSAQALLLCYSYAKDPMLKGEFMRTNRGKLDPVLFLLLNDPEITAQMDRSSLPKSLDFGSVRCGMSSRTNWDISDESDAAAAEIRGGGYHYGNHQLSDAGAFQIFYRGQLVSPLGMYKFYGTPYDMNFNKRSVSQSMMLVFDPNEVFFRNMGNDGGSRLVQKNPADCRELTSLAIHYYGKKLFCAFLPSASENKFSIYSANLAGAYSAKIKNLVRTFCFVNYNDPQRPAVAVVYDRLEKSDANFKSFWQITTLVKPEFTEQGVRLTSYRRNKGKTGKLDLWMYKPTLKECKLEILSGKDSCNVFGKQYIAPAQGLPEAQGSRVMFSPRKNAAEQEFLAIMDIYGSEASPRKAVVLENNSCFVVAADNQVVVLPRNSRLQQQSFSFKLPESSGKRSIAVANLAAGLWQIKTNKNKILQLEAVQGIHTLYIESADSAFELSPVSDK